MRTGGSGPPVVLLHGHPAHAHHLAPGRAAAGRGRPHRRLPRPARVRPVVASRPRPTTTRRTRSARMAGDVVALMRRLGHERFAVVGHDRGSYVAMRMAMDHPDAVTHLAVLDCLPIVEHLERTDARFATAWWHWFFFAQPDKPERAITRRPRRLVRRRGPGQGRGDGGGEPRRPPGGHQRPGHRARRCSRTTAPAWASTAPPRRPTAPPAAGSPARRWCCGRAATTSRSCTATRGRSGRTGPTDLRGGGPDRQRAPHGRGGARSSWPAS